MKNKQSMELLLEIKTSNTDMKNVIESTIKSMDSLSDGISKNLDKITKSFGSSMMGVTTSTESSMKEISRTIGQIAQLLAQIQDKPRAAMWGGDASKLNTSVKLKGMEGVQKGILNRANTSYRAAVGSEGFELANQIMGKYAAMNSMLSTSIKGFGTAKDYTGAAQAMRSLTKLDRYIGERFIGSDFTKALNLAGNQTGKAQKQATEKLVNQMRSLVGVDDKQMDSMARFALMGVDQDPRKWAENMKSLGRQAFKKATGKKLSETMFVKEYNKSIRTVIADIRKNGNQDEMDYFSDQVGLRLPKDPGQGAGRAEVGQYTHEYNKAVNEVARRMSRLRAVQTARTYGENSAQASSDMFINNMPEMKDWEMTGPPQVRTGIKGLFDKVANMFKKSEKHVSERSGEAEAAMMRGFDAFGYRMITISYMLSKVNFALDNAITGLINSGVSRQRSMGKIQPILTGGVSSSGNELGSYRAEMESIAAETGIGFDQLAQSMYDTASAFPNVENKMDALRVTAKLTSVGFGGATASMEGLIAVAKTYNRDLETDSQAFSAAMETLGDLSVAAANVGTLEVSELGDAMQTMAPTAANLGITIRELYASIASTSGVIGNTSEAANKLKQLFTALNSPNTKMQAFYKEQNVANGASFIKQAGGIQQAMAILDKKVGPSGNFKSMTGRSQAQEAIFGLSNADDLFKAFVDMKSTLLELENATWKATHGVAYWSTEYAASMEQYKTIQAEVGESLLPFKVGIQNATNAILGLSMNLNPFLKTFIPTIFQVTATLSKIIAPFLGFAGAIALATRALSQMSGEVMSGKSVELFLKNIGNKADHIQASDYTTVATNLGRNTVYKTGFVDSNGKMRMDQNVGSATGLNTGGAMAVLGKIAMGVTALVVVISLVSAANTWLKNIAKKKGDDAVGEKSVVAQKTQFSELAQAMINQVEKSYTKGEISSSKDAALKFAEKIESIATTIDAAIKKLELTGSYSDKGVLIRPNDTAAELATGDFGTAAKALADKYSQGGFSQIEIDQSIVQLKNEASQFRTLVAAVLGARPNQTKDVVEAMASDDLEKSMKESIRGIFSNIILDAKDVISPYNYQDAAGTAAKKLAEDERERIIKGGGTVAEGTAGYESTIKRWDAMFKTFSAYAGWSEQNQEYLKLKGVKDGEGSVPSEVANLTGALTVMREVMAKTTANAGKFGDDLSTSGAIGNSLAVLESAFEKVSEAALAADSNFNGLSDELNKFRREAAIESMVNADKMNQRTIRSVSGQFNNPSQQSQAYATLIGAMNGDSTPEALEKALLGLSGKTDKYSRMTESGIASVSSMGGNRGLLGALGGILNDQGDITNVARALSSTGIMIGEGADRMSAAAYFLSGAANMTEETFRDLINQFDLTTPADAALYTELIRGFDVFSIAAQTAADALNDNKNSFLRPGQQDAISLRRQASELRQQYQPGSAFYDPGVAGSPAAISSVNALADRLEKQARVKSALSGLDGNPMESFLLQGGGFDIANAVPGFLSSMFQKGKGAIRSVVDLNAKAQAWGAGPKMNYVDKWVEDIQYRPGFRNNETGGLERYDAVASRGMRKVGGEWKREGVKYSMASVGQGIKEAFEKPFNFMFKKDQVDRGAMANGNPGQYTTGFGSMLQNAGSSVSGFFKKDESGSSGAGNLMSGVLGGLGSFVTMILSSVSSLKSIQAVLSPFRVIMDSMMKVLGPVIDQVLAPLIGIFVIIGQLLGQLLVPILMAFMPVIMAVVEIFVMLYNMLLPVFEFVLDVFTLFGVYVNNMVLAMMSAVSYLTFWDESDDHYRNDYKNRETLGAAASRIFGTQTLQAIKLEQVSAAGGSYLAGDDSSSSANGSSADTSKAPDQYFNFYIGSDAITDVNGGKIVSVEYILDQFQARLAQTATMQA